MTQKKETSNSLIAVSPKSMKDMKSPKRKNKEVKTENGSAVDTDESLKKDRATAKKGSKISEKISEEATQQDIKAEDTCNTTLYVSRLHHKLGFKQFKMHFAQFGKVTKCFLSEPGHQNSNKGFGFVTYKTEKDMKKALEAQHELKGQAAEVQINQPKPKTTEKVSKKRKHQDDTSAGPLTKKACQLHQHELFVGDLPVKTSMEKVQKHFSYYGEVANVFVPKKLDGKGLKYFFVSFKEASSLQAALEAKEHKINKTQACIKLRKDGKNVDMTVQPQPAKAKVYSEVSRNADPEAYERTLFVGQLDYASKPAAVQEHFSKYGKVTGLTMPRHPRNEGQSKGFALVEFDTSVGFQKALKAKKHKIDEKVLKVIQTEEPRTKKEKKEKVGAKTEKYELFVAEIPTCINNKALEIHFSSYGKLVEVIRPMRQNQRKVRNYAFVEYQTREGLMAALADPRHKIAGEPLIVRESKGTDQKKTVKENGTNEITAVDDMNGGKEATEEEEEEEDDDDEGEDEDDE